MKNAVPGKEKTAVSRKINSYSAIVAQRITKHQLFLICNQNRLTDALDILKSLGITGDLAICFIAVLQNLEVAA